MQRNYNGQVISGLILLMCWGLIVACAAAPARDLPALRRNGAQTQLIVDGQPYLILGVEVDNSSSSSLEYMRASWEKLNAIHANTAVVPLSWELIEPQEGKFDFTLVDGLIAGARAHNLHLVFLWFGTWKNTFSSYAPAWVKMNRQRFMFAQPKPGQNWGAISAWSEAARQADARAFAAVMRRIRQLDEKQHTVLLMQIENETGLIGGSRDHVPPAEAAFAQAVPAALAAYLQAHHDTLIPELRTAWEAAGAHTSGTWSEVFGTVADEVFMAWHYGRYVDSIAVAGKQEYPLPMFVNAWLEGAPGSYPIGGPVSRMMDIWRVAAPHVDMLAPDIYGDAQRFKEVCGWYTRSQNPLMIVESTTHALPANAFTAIASFGAMGVGPYALEEPFDTAAVGEVYSCLENMMPLLTRYQGSGQMVDILLDNDAPQEFNLNGYHLKASPFPPKSDKNPPNDQQNKPLPGHGLILALAPGDFIVVGAGFSLDFSPLPGNPAHVEVLSRDEGRFEKGAWIPGRRLNGDEYEGALRLGDKEPGYTGKRQTLHLRRLKVFSY